MSVFFDWRRRRRKWLLATNISLLLRSPAAFAILQCYAFMLFSPQVNMCKHNDLRKKMQPYGLSRIAFRGGEEEIRTLEPLLTVTRFPVARPRPN